MKQIRKNLTFNDYLAMSYLAIGFLILVSAFFIDDTVESIVTVLLGLHFFNALDVLHLRELVEEMKRKNK